MVEGHRHVGPARAGMIRPSNWWMTPSMSWPRTSGDDPQSQTRGNTQMALAPHERG